MHGNSRDGFLQAERLSPVATISAKPALCQIFLKNYLYAIKTLAFICVFRVQLCFLLLLTFWFPCSSVGTPVLARMFHGNAEFWGNLSEPVFTIARGSIAIATVQGGS